ncbi:MAG TPA: amidophosphoribosyltransferase [Prolixibacteraceae bacterium]|nr:amidophosphoribosyltransferase [Prolixibacteraceae bacterium]HPR60315.1 amidophosphoribosyltransferase [Prolixibacteraceae bacterium]
MSEAIKHECGVAMIRLLKPLSYYKEKYGSWMYGLNKLYLLMEKQHNRGQDGAGVVSLKIDSTPGEEYLDRLRSVKANPIKDIFDHITKNYKKVEAKNGKCFSDPEWAKEHLPFVAEAYLGHLRYGTFGRNSIEFVHPVMRQNNWRSKNLVLAGNFNLTNTDELFDKLVGLGQHPSAYTDTVTILEKVGHFLDQENEFKFRQYKNEGQSNKDISPLIEKNLDIQKILENASRDWDGGYTIAGMVGHGDLFVTRDPWGIRPAFYYHDDEIVVVASERPVIQTTMNVKYDKVKEVKPGEAIIIKKDGSISTQMVRVPHQRKSCSFERIYFSRGSDRDIYIERKNLGRYLAPIILEKVNFDLENTVFSYIPNTAETAFYGIMEGVREHLLDWKKKKIKALNGNLTEEKIAEIISVQPRMEKIAIKDVKLRTFITDDNSRDDLVAHVYDVTYGIVRNNEDTLVVIDDSIVRGTTLKESILRMLDRLNPKKIIIVSSAPQIRYPDCYGIDMAQLGKFAAFNAAISLLKETGQQSVIDEVYRKCYEQRNFAKEEIVNYVKDIYKPFTPEQISAQIARMLKPDDCKAEVELVYQTIENLHKASPEHTGDWYFTGDYPTPGGNKVVNNSFILYYEGRDGRAY